MNHLEKKLGRLEDLFFLSCASKVMTYAETKTAYKKEFGAKLDASAMTRRYQQLQSMGLVRIASHLHGGRGGESKTVYMTDEGKRYREKMKSEFTKFVARNPHGLIDFDKNVMQDAIRASEMRFHKPLNRFEKSEFDFLWKLYAKAADNRISLKVYPDSQNNPTIDQKKLIADLKQFRFGIVGYFVLLYIASIRGGKIDQLVTDLENSLQDSRSVLVPVSAALLSMSKEEREEILHRAFKKPDMALVHVPAPKTFRQFSYMAKFVKDVDSQKAVNKLAKGEQFLDIYESFRKGFPEERGNPHRKKYNWFLVDKDGEVLSGWEFRVDAEDAQEDEAVATVIRYKNFVSKDALERFATRNGIELKGNPRVKRERSRPAKACELRAWRTYRASMRKCRGL